ncbi:MAG TPA: MBL fold hydrolase [Erysipelotrichaceae bacterium]|nr:MBL fold hydrolase [Erysipelotrichaceae bacterium]
MLKHIRKLILCAALFAAAGCAAQENIEADQLSVKFFNAGKADAILLYTDESAVLIDTGLDGFAPYILHTLNELDIQTLDTLILTHFDKDHIGSADEILESVEVGRVLVSDWPKDSDEYADLMAALETAGIESEVVFGDDQVSFMLDGAEYTIDGPDASDYDKDDSNNSSLIVTVQYGQTSFLLMGDAQNERIKEFLSQDSSEYDVLKVPYHGNYQKQLKNLIPSADPEYAVITCSASEGGEAKTLDLLEEYDIEVFLTSEGNVSIVSDGKNITASYD